MDRPGGKEGVVNIMGKPPLGMKEPPRVSQRIRDFARGQECALQMEGVCNRDPATTVHCHVRMAGLVGISQKPPDLMGFHGCSDCHLHEKEAGHDDILRAVLITQHRLWKAGLLEMT